MNSQTAGYLVILGIFVILLGLMGFQLHPDKSPIAVLLGGGFGVLVVLWGILGARGVRRSRWGAQVTVALMLLFCLWRAGTGWVAVAQGEVERAFAAFALTLMLVTGGTLLWLLQRDRTAS